MADKPEPDLPVEPDVGQVPAPPHAPVAGAMPVGQVPPGAWMPPPGWVPTGYAASAPGAPSQSSGNRRSWRTWSGSRRFLVPGLIGLVLGGVLGSGITALATSGDDHRRVPVSRFGPGLGGFGPGYGDRGGNGFGPNAGNRGDNGFGPNGNSFGPNGNGGNGQTVPTPQPTTTG